ncbi:MAG: glycosyltransferase family 4 protein [Lachnospiraceae bacterium]|nr:glycosyltransferase family 4 protein [Lachnospiraceae bacterium]
MPEKFGNVCVYTGGLHLIRKSGVGRAIEHQIAALKSQGIRVNEAPLRACSIVHINSVFPRSVITALYARRHGVKVIWYGHSTMEDFRNSFTGSNLLAPLFKKWITFCYNLADVIITPTPYSKSILNTYPIRKPILVCSNGVDTDFWKGDESAGLQEREAFLKKYRLPTDRKLVMSVGHFMERKGILEFIALAKRHPEITFLWFGHTDAVLTPAKIKSAMKAAPDNLHFAGFVNSEELRRAYLSCDLFLFLTHEETEGIVVLEAMACRIPVIVRDIPVYEGWLTDQENVLKFRDESQLEGMLSTALTTDQSAMTKKARSTAEERSLTVVGKKLTEIYRLLKYSFKEVR